MAQKRCDVYFLYKEIEYCNIHLILKNFWADVICEFEWTESPINTFLWNAENELSESVLHNFVFPTLMTHKR